MSDQYIIVFPGSNKNRLSIVCLEQCNTYQLDEYDRASRHLFYDPQDVVDYAQQLALKNNLPLCSNDDLIQELLGKKDEGFLD